jgi:hypothetical protein
MWITGPIDIVHVCKMATEALFDSVEVEAVGSTNMSDISVIG